MAEIKWAYGVTTVKERLGDTLPRSLGSLLRGGFPQPRLFVDDCDDPNLCAFAGLEVTCRYPRIRTYGNWSLAAHELFYRNPDASHYAIFQDDMICVRNIREYLEATMPSDGYLNLYTVPQNEALAVGKRGWFHSNQQGRGALALVFTRALLLELLSNREWLERPLNADKGYRNIDGGIIHCLSTQYKGTHKEYCHNPSLVQHIGTETTMVPVKKFADVSQTFLGEEFDALSLLTVEPGLVEEIPHSFFTTTWATQYSVLEALKILGIDPNRVVEWVKRPCTDCQERQRRLNQLGWLSKKALDGATDEVKARFEEILNN